MLKKSDIQALLDRLPDEFEAETFQRQLDEVSHGPVPQWQLDAAFETLERVRREGSNPIEEVEARFKAWAESVE